MNSHRFIEEENALLKERIRVLEHRVKYLESVITYVGLNAPIELLADLIKMAGDYKALTPQPKDNHE